MQVPSILLTQTCTIEPYLDRAPEGPAYSSQVVLKCRNEITKKRIKTDKGVEFVPDCRLFLQSNEMTRSIKAESLVEVDGVKYSVADVVKQRGFASSHVELILK